MFSLLSWILTGLSVGLVTWAFVPGWQHIGFTTTLVLGVVGACLGGLISAAIWPIWTNEPDLNRMWPGCLMSVAGAVAALWGYPGVRAQRDVAYAGH